MEDQRELISKTEGTGVDGDQGMVLVYRLLDRVSIVATSRKNGDAEIIIRESEARKLGQALLDSLESK